MILKGVGGLYTLELENHIQVLAKPRGILRRLKQRPLPGDEVLIAPSGDPDCPYAIEEILPRRNELIRPRLANLDYLLIVLSICNPPADYTFLDKMLIVAAKHNIKPLICFTKGDLLNATQDAGIKAEFAANLNLYQTIGYTCLISDLHNPDTVRNYLKPLLRERRLALCGQSGVGKSTLLNLVFEQEQMATGLVSAKLGRGKHTTRHAEFFEWEGGYIADTPGFSALEINDLGIDFDDIQSGYPEIADAARCCRFQTCRHTIEPDCAVLENQEIDRDRLERYWQLCSQLSNKY